jgi:hypothetical protein
MEHIMTFDPARSTAVREHLASLAEVPVRRHRVALGIGAFALGSLLIGGAAVASGLIALPGADIVTPLADEVTGEFTGTGTLDLGPRPDGATSVEVWVTCLTAGHFFYPDGANMVCDDEDDPRGGKGGSGYTIPLAEGEHTVTITAGVGERWSIVASYVNEAPTDWGVNDRGESFGVEKDDASPDLLAAYATNGQQGYIRVAELAAIDGSSVRNPKEAAAWEENHPKGTSAEIPVYESDGVTEIGVFSIEY